MSSMFKPNPSQALSLVAAASLSHFDGLGAPRGALDQLRPPSLAPTLKPTSSRPPSTTNPVVIDSDFVRDSTLFRDRSYVIDGEVHVRSGVTLTVEDGATILIRNGLRARRTIDTSALIFDSGSALRAGTVTFSSADETGARVTQPDNGGVFFCGSHRAGTKDGVSSVRRFTSSSFRAERIVLDHVGRPDPREGDGNDNDRDDIDALSIIGVGQSEWNIKGVESHGSGDDGFDVYNSSISLDTLIITNPTEDGVNLTSSSVTVHCSCDIDMSNSPAADRELFDFEIDNGRCRFILAPHTLVRLSGNWGNLVDDARLRSTEMPRPPALGSIESRYECNITLSKRAVVYSASSD
jgi:hypothetical protein